jgi:superfamily II DNA/RNA helicase
MFCCGVQHAYHVCEALRARGVTAAAVTAETPSDQREAIVNAFRRGDIRALTNINILTTGFDVPAVDLIAMLRPTLPPASMCKWSGADAVRRLPPPCCVDRLLPPAAVTRDLALRR